MPAKAIAPLAIILPIVILIVILGLAPAPLFANDKTIKRIENYINNITTMQGSFTQDGPQNNQAVNFSKGKFWISRPGKMRFQYTSPHKMYVIADGVWLAVKPKARLPFERYPLDATPARFLLRQNLSIKDAAQVENLIERGNKISLWLTSKDARLAGKIQLRFRKNPLALEGWTILDAQGMTTEIRLKNVQRGAALDPSLFFIQNETIFKKRRR